MRHFPNLPHGVQRMSSCRSPDKCKFLRPQAQCDVWTIWRCRPRYWSCTSDRWRSRSCSCTSGWWHWACWTHSPCARWHPSPCSGSQTTPWSSSPWAVRAGWEWGCVCYSIPILFQGIYNISYSKIYIYIYIFIYIYIYIVYIYIYIYIYIHTPDSSIDAFQKGFINI